MAITQKNKAMNKNQRIIAAAKQVAATYGEELTGDAVHEWISVTGAADFGISTDDTDAVTHIAIEVVDEFGAIDLDSELEKYYKHQ